MDLFFVLLMFRWEEYSLNVLVENIRGLKMNKTFADAGMETSATTISRSESTHRAAHVPNCKANVNTVYLIHGEREKMSTNQKKRYEQLVSFNISVFIFKFIIIYLLD